MGHVSHEGTLPDTRLVSPFRFFLQSFLLLNEVGYISNHTISSHLFTVLEVRNAVDKVPLQVLIFMEERVHIGEGRLGFVEEVIRIAQTLTERVVYEMGNEFVKSHLRLRIGHTFIEGDFFFLKIGTEEAHVNMIHQVLQLFLVQHNLFVGVQNDLLIHFVVYVELSFLADITDRD